MNDRQISRLFWGAKALLIAALLYVAIEAIWHPSEPVSGLKPKAVSGGERVSDESGQAPDFQPDTDYSVIVESGLFGVTDQTSASPTLSSPPAGPLRSAEALGLRLVGIVAGGPATSRAIIEDMATQATSPYKIGDVIASATIQSIESDRIVLVHNGQSKVLPLHAGRASRSPARFDANDAGQASPPRPLDAVQQPSAPSARVGYVEDLFRSATIEPYVKNGRTEGLRITGLEQSPLAAIVGLRNGDIVQTVNGQTLDSKQKAFQVLKKARTQSPINMQLLRNGKTKDLSLDL
jgi:type II secretion system protein C